MGRLARVFLTLLDTELKRTDVISGWNPSLVGAGRAEPKGTEWGRMEPSGANRKTGEGDERAIYPVRRHVPTAGQNSRKSSIPSREWPQAENVTQGRRSVGRLWNRYKFFFGRRLEGLCIVKTKI